MRESATVAELSPRHLEVIALVAEGLSNGAIAERLCITHRTVEGHLTRIYLVLGIGTGLDRCQWHQRVLLARWWLQQTEYLC